MIEVITILRVRVMRNTFFIQKLDTGVNIVFRGFGTHPMDGFQDITQNMF